MGVPDLSLIDRAQPKLAPHLVGSAQVLFTQRIPQISMIAGLLLKAFWNARLYGFS